MQTVITRYERLGDPMQTVITRYDELYHFGVKGMKWGVRRYRNKDGSLISSAKEKRLKQDSIRLKKSL